MTIIGKQMDEESSFPLIREMPKSQCIRLLSDLTPEERDAYWTESRPCAECGEPESLRTSWHAPDALYIEVWGSKRGHPCMVCFNRKAKENIGMDLTWVPFVWQRSPFGNCRGKQRINESQWNDIRDNYYE